MSSRRVALSLMAAVAISALHSLVALARLLDENDQTLDWDDVADVTA
jgi:hypothetical protein